MKQVEKKKFLHSALFKYAQINSNTLDFRSCDVTKLCCDNTCVVTLPRKKTMQMSRESELNWAAPAKSPALLGLLGIGEFLPQSQHFLIIPVASLQFELR